MNIKEKVDNTVKQIREKIQQEINRCHHKDQL